MEECCRGETSITLIVSQLERIVVKQTTVAQEWKMQRDAVRAAEAAKLQGLPLERSSMLIGKGITTAVPCREQRSGSVLAGEGAEADESRQQPGAGPEGGRSPSAGLQEAGSAEDAAPVNV